MAGIWKICLEASFGLPSIADYRWDQNANIWWIKELISKAIDKILINDKYNENEVIDEEDKSHSNGDTF